MPDILLPDGTVQHFADGTPDSHIERVLRRRFPPPPREPARTADVIDFVPRATRVDFFDRRRQLRVMLRRPRR